MGRTPDARSTSVTVVLDPERARTLAALAELYHATPERLVTSWAAYHIDRLAAGLTPDTDPSSWSPDRLHGDA